MWPGRMVKNPGEYTSRVQDIMTVTLLNLFLGWSFVCLRLYIKTFLTRVKWWWDDYFIIAALLVGSLQCVANIVQIQFGFGFHLDTLIIPESDITKARWCFYIAEISYMIAVSTVKLSILCFMFRLAKELRPFIWFGLIFTGGTLIASACAAAFECHPIDHQWDAHPGTCINRTAFFYSNAALNIIMDLYIYILPMRTLWKIQLPKKQRIGLVLVFAVGMFVVITGFLRLHSLRTATVTKDFTWDNVPASLWSQIEINVGIVCACLPCIKPLISRFMPSFDGTKFSLSAFSRNTRKSQMSASALSGNRTRLTNTGPPEGTTTSGYPMHNWTTSKGDDDIEIKAYEARITGRESIGAGDDSASWSPMENDSKERITNDSRSVAGSAVEHPPAAVTTMSGIYKTTNITISKG